MNPKLTIFLLILIPVLFLFGEPASPAALDQTVYITATGQMYHMDGCTSLRQTQISVSLADALRSGHRPCSRCNPPVFENPGDMRRNTKPLYRLNVAGVTQSGAADINQMLRVEVVGHVDGDTVRVRIPNPPEGLSVVETIRLLGVDTPETRHPSRGVEHFGQEASDFTKNTLFGKTVFLAFDWDLRDRYGRLLAYIYTEDGRCFNALLIQEGYGHAYTRFPFQFMEEFRTLEQEARREVRGLWAAR